MKVLVIALFAIALLQCAGVYGGNIGHGAGWDSLELADQDHAPRPAPPEPTNDQEVPSHAPLAPRTVVKRSCYVDTDGEQHCTTVVCKPPPRRHRGTWRCVGK